MLALILLAQLNAPPARPTAHAVPAGPRSLADVARERPLLTGGVRPTPIVLKLATPAPVQTYRAHSLEELNAALARPTPIPTPAPTIDPAFTPIPLARSSAGGPGIENFLYFVIFVWLLSPFIGIGIAKAKGYPGWQGALAALFLGPFVLLIALISRSNKKCPYCISSIPIAASVCPRCQREQPK
jgi:hypothetical protein